MIQIEIYEWKDFEEILLKAKIRLYHIEWSYDVKLILTAIIDEYVFRYRAPEKKDRKKLVCGYEVEDLDLNKYPNVKIEKYGERKALEKRYLRSQIRKILDRYLIKKYSLKRGYVLEEICTQ